MKRIGILITHGTDTLAWSLPYIRYAIKNNHANICLTGSQIPLPATSAFSDAFLNLDNSIRFLSTLEPPNIFAVFNYGRSAFSDSLRKIDRWNCEAFVGDEIARMEWGDIKYHDESLRVCEPSQMDRFHVITTGGTIDATPDANGVFSPSEDHALKYLVAKYAHYFKDLSRDPVFSIDSSDLTFERMAELAGRVASCLREEFDDSFADMAFEPGVRIVYTDPLKRTDDYRRETEDAKGVVIAGYGGGNVNIDSETPAAVLPLIRELIESGTPVVLSSQVPIGAADFIYENGYVAVEAGAIPGVDLSLPEAQLRLAYILGHESEIERCRHANASKDLDRLAMIRRVFLSGVKFRNAASRTMLERLIGEVPACEDLLVDRPFETALAACLECGPAAG